MKHCVICSFLSRKGQYKVSNLLVKQVIRLCANCLFYIQGEMLFSCLADEADLRQYSPFIFYAIILYMGGYST